MTPMREHSIGKSSNDTALAIVIGSISDPVTERVAPMRVVSANPPRY
jgi:hypothetical protein